MSGVVHEFKFLIKKFSMSEISNSNLAEINDDLITVCISGKLLSGRKKADYIVPLLAVGIELVDEVSADLTFLVQAELHNDTAKSLKAKKLGVQIIDENELVRLTDGLPILQIERSSVVREKLIKAIKLRDKLIQKLNSLVQDDSEAIKRFLKTLELSAEGFTPILTKTSVLEIDRTASMVAGPFFTSEEFPIPYSSDGMMLPLIQLDLREISRLSNKDLGDSLLQLWIDPDWSASSRGLIRNVPREELLNSNLTEFDYELHLEAFQSPVPIDLIYEPSDEFVNIITGYRSIGLRCQDSYLDLYDEELSIDVLQLIENDTQAFKSLLSVNEGLGILGSFYPIQYSAADSSMYCLTEFPMWGASGNAQILYDCGDDWMVFDFQESLR